MTGQDRLSIFELIRKGESGDLEFKTARRILSKLEEYGLIKRYGRGNNIYYTSP